MFLPRHRPRLLRTLWGFLYAFLVLLTVCVTLLSCVLLLSQAVSTSPRRTWRNNYNALVIGASYIIVFAVSVVLCMKRRIAVRSKLQRISKVHRMLGKTDMPKSVHEYVTQEYARTCLVAFDSQPKNVSHHGWGSPGSKYGEIYYRTVLLDTIHEIDTLAHQIIPTHPALKPHARMLHHFRFILPLLPSDEDNLTPLHYYDSAIQLATASEREPTEREFEVGLEAAVSIRKILEECLLEMAEESIKA